MRFLITFKMAFRALRRNKMRSILTALGIIIGVGAVIAMFSLGNGAKSIVEASVASLGQNLITIDPGNFTAAGVRSGAGGALSLTPEDAKAIADNVDGVAGVSPMRTGSRFTLLANGLNWSATVQGVGPDFPYIRGWKVEQGSFFDEPEVATFAKVAILGKTVVDKLFPEMDPIGQTVRIGAVPFKIIGVMAQKGYNLSGMDQDDTVLIPYLTHMKRLSRTTSLSQIIVQAKDAETLPQVQEDITTALMERRTVSEPDFTVRNQEEIAAARNTATTAMTGLIGMIAGVSLLVGGIGIMNIMLVSVTERTREIGIRMALGAHGSDVLTQFLIEAIALSSLGGILGIIIGVGGSEIMGRTKGWAVEADMFSIVLAVGGSALIGVIAGYYPARKAAKLDPIEALRFE